MASIDNDAEQPTNICKECKIGQPQDRANGSTPADQNKCCFNGQALSKLNNPYDILIAQCPTRTQVPDSTAGRLHEIDGCTWSPDNLESWDNLPFAINYNLYVTNPIWGQLTISGNLSSIANADKILPCNAHDLCYQTCGNQKMTCDDALVSGIDSSCDTGYPFPATDLIKPSALSTRKNTIVAKGLVLHSGMV
ncbi:MAG: hypothetical protein IPP36_06885 [Nitrosomonadales bacterium]|nr:hypothetical protein [Nitrosomonadales bacterium]